MASNPAPDIEYSLVQPGQSTVSINYNISWPKYARMAHIKQVHIKYPKCNNTFSKVFYAYSRMHHQQEVENKLANRFREKKDTGEDMLPWRSKRFRDPPGPKTALLSYPGSGNTWARHLLEDLTGLYI